MRFGGARAWFAAAVTAAMLLGASAAEAKQAHHPQPPNPYVLKHLKQVRREMHAAMKRERVRHKARMGELVHRDRMARKHKDIDEQQRVKDLIQAERLLFAQRMRDIRAKAPEPR
jgi:hypothetical protein